jgi:hypothetical protein
MAPDGGVEPTAPGHVWVCCSCPEKAELVLDARAHVEETEEKYRRGDLPYQHAMFESPGGDRSNGTARWIYAHPPGQLRIGLRSEYEERSELYRRKGKKRGA